MRSALDAVSDGLKNLQTSMRPAMAGRVSLEPALDHPLAAPQAAPSPREDTEQAHAQPGPRINRASVRGNAQAAGGSAAGRWGSGGASSSGQQADSDWCDLGSSAAGVLRGSMFDARVQQFQRELQASGDMDMANVRALAFDGVPDRDGLRAIVWKVRHPPCSTLGLTGFKALQQHRHGKRAGAVI